MSNVKEGNNRVSQEKSGEIMQMESPLSNLQVSNISMLADALIHIAPYYIPTMYLTETYM
jgi:hypothetical protein